MLRVVEIREAAVTFSIIFLSYLRCKFHAYRNKITLINLPHFTILKIIKGKMPLTIRYNFQRFLGNK